MARNDEDGQRKVRARQPARAARAAQAGADVAIDAAIAWRGYFLLYALPVAWLAGTHLQYLYWVLSAIGIAAWTRELAMPPRARPATAAVVAGVTGLGNLMLATSLYIQRTGFNDAFFYHADWTSVAMAWQGFRVEALSAAAWWIAVTSGPLWVAHTSRNSPVKARHRRWRAAAVVVGVVTYAPAISLGGYVAARSDARAAPILLAPARPPEGETRKRPAEGLPNLVFIFAEALESTYGNAQLMGEDFTPRLTALQGEAAQFTEMIQLPPASWTMGGMVAALCSVPLPIPTETFGFLGHQLEALTPMNTLSGAVLGSLADHDCLGDILARHGYRRVYYSGFPLAFAGRGAFLADHGFEEQYGLEALRDIVEHPNVRGRWGLHDDDVLEVAWEGIERLRREDEGPYAVLINTVDVDPRRVSRSCGRAPRDRRAGFAQRCADRLIAELIERVQGASPETVVVIMSDHLAFPNETIARVGDQEARRLRFAIWGPDVEPGEIARRGTHYDVAPTVLDAMGLDAYRRHHLGASLLAHESPWWSHETAHAMRPAPAVLPIRIGPGERIVLRSETPTIEIDSQTIVANRHGYALNDAVFTMRFHDDGRFDRVAYWQSPRKLERKEAGRLVVGVSTNKSFNRAFGNVAAGVVTYFAGRVGSEAGLMTGSVGKRTVIELPEAMFKTPR